MSNGSDTTLLKSFRLLVTDCRLLLKVSHLKAGVSKGSSIRDILRLAIEWVADLLQNAARVFVTLKTFVFLVLLSRNPPLKERP